MSKKNPMPNPKYIPGIRNIGDGPVWVAGEKLYPGDLVEFSDRGLFKVTHATTSIPKGKLHGQA